MKIPSLLFIKKDNQNSIYRHTNFVSKKVAVHIKRFGTKNVRPFFGVFKPFRVLIFKMQPKVYVKKRRIGGFLFRGVL